MSKNTISALGILATLLIVEDVGSFIAVPYRKCSEQSANKNGTEERCGLAESLTYRLSVPL
jgi:hypothetical protein